MHKTNQRIKVGTGGLNTQVIGGSTSKAPNDCRKG